MAPACSAVQNFTPHDFEGCTRVPMATSNFLGRPSSLRNGANPSWTDVWAKPGSCVAAMIPRGPLHFCVPAPAGPKSSAHVEPYHRPSRQRALARLIATSVTHWVVLWVAPCQTRTGGWPASELPTEALVLAAPRNMPLPPTSPAWPSLKSAHLAWFRVSTTLTEVSGALTLCQYLISGILPNASINGSPSTPSQKSLSAKIEAKACRHLLDHSSQEHHRRAHFCINRIPGIGAWLFAFPDSLESHIPTPLFRVSLRRRLRMSVWSQDTNCTLCGQVMDKWGGRALVCGCVRRHRVTCHNLIRDVVHSCRQRCRANLAAVLEKPGLLVPRDPVDDDRRPDPDPPGPSVSSRRQADVWVPRGPAVARWDFSITGAFRLGPALSDPAAFTLRFRKLSLNCLFAGRNNSNFGLCRPPGNL